MKYLKKFNESNIDSICEKYNIVNYTINSDGSIDVDGDVEIIGESLTLLPLNFNKVSGNFNCSINDLISLKGCPKYIDGNFYCYCNQLTTFEYFPISIGQDGDFVFSNNPVFCFRNYIENQFDKIEIFNEFRILKDNTVYIDRLSSYCKMNGYSEPDTTYLKKIGYIIK